MEFATLGEVCDRDPGALGGQRIADGGADSRRAAGDEGDPVVQAEVEIHCVIGHVVCLSIQAGTAAAVSARFDYPRVTMVTPRREREP
jgi:hypothetical protein